MRIRHAIASLALLAALPALAFDRPFPKDIKRGRMTPSAFPNVVIDGKTRMLAIGARIWNAENLIEQPSAIRGSDITVNYTETEQGEIDRVWILTREEASRSVADQLQHQSNE
jgi:hypothetical protein